MSTKGHQKGKKNRRRQRSSSTSSEANSNNSNNSSSSSSSSVAALVADRGRGAVTPTPLPQADPGAAAPGKGRSPAQGQAPAQAPAAGQAWSPSGTGAPGVAGGAGPGSGQPAPRSQQQRRDSSSGRSSSSGSGSGSGGSRQDRGGRAGQTRSAGRRLGAPEAAAAGAESGGPESASEDGSDSEVSSATRSEGRRQTRTRDPQVGQKVASDSAAVPTTAAGATGAAGAAGAAPGPVAGGSSGSRALATPAAARTPAARAGPIIEEAARHAPPKLRQDVPLFVSGCGNPTISEIIHGTYFPYSTNHGKVVYKKEDEDDDSGALDVLIYYWDDRDGPELCGWWFGPNTGGEMVWAYHPSRKATTPPAAEWNVPHDGPIDPGFIVSAARPAVDGSKRVRTSSALESADAQAPAKQARVESSQGEEQPKQNHDETAPHCEESQDPRKARRTKSPEAGPDLPHAEGSALGTQAYFLDAYKRRREDLSSREEPQEEQHRRSEEEKLRRVGGDLQPPPPPPGPPPGVKPATSGPEVDLEELEQEEEEDKRIMEQLKRRADERKRRQEALQKRKLAEINRQHAMDVEAEDKEKGRPKAAETSTESAPKHQDTSRLRKDKERENGKRSQDEGDQRKPVAVEASEARAERQQQAIQAVLACFQKLSEVSLESFPEVEAEFEQVMKMQLPETGAQQDILKEEANRVFLVARQYIEQIREQQRSWEEMKLKQQREEQARREESRRQEEERKKEGERQKQEEERRAKEEDRRRREEEEKAREKEKAKEREREREKEREKEREREREKEKEREREKEKEREKEREKQKERERAQREEEEEEQRRAEEERKRRERPAEPEVSKEELRRKKEEERRRHEEELQRRREERRKRERSELEKEEEKRRAEREVRRKEEEEKRREQRERDAVLEKQRAEEEKVKREEEAKQRREQQATLAVLRGLQKLSDANPENFEALRAEFEEVMKTELPDTGAQQEMLKAEAERVFGYAQQYVEQVKAQQKQAQELEAQRRAQAKVQEKLAMELLEELQRRVTLAEAAAEKAREAASPLASPFSLSLSLSLSLAPSPGAASLSLDKERLAGPVGQGPVALEDKETLRLARGAERAGRSAASVCADCAAFLEQKRPAILEAEALREESSKLLQMASTRLAAADRLSQETQRQAKCQRERVAKARAPKLLAQRATDIFRKYDRDGDGALSRAEVLDFCRLELAFTLPEPNLERIFRQLLPLGAAGLPPALLQRLRSALGIARHEARMALRGLDPEERQRKEAEAATLLEARGRARAEAAAATLGQLRDAKDSVSGTLAATEQACETLASAAEGTAEELLQKVQAAEVALGSARAGVTDFQQKRQCLQRDVISAQGSLEEMRLELKSMGSCGKVFCERLQKAEETISKSRCLAEDKASEEREKQRLDVANKLRGCIESLGGKVVDLFHVISKGGGETVTIADIHKFLAENNCELQLELLNRVFEGGLQVAAVETKREADNEEAGDACATDTPDQAGHARHVSSTAVEGTGDPHPEGEEKCNGVPENQNNEGEAVVEADRNGSSVSAPPEQQGQGSTESRGDGAETQPEGTSETDSAPRIDRDNFMRLVRIFWKVTREVTLSDAAGAGAPIRNLDAGEVVEVLQGPTPGSDGDLRLRACALRDGAQGWASVSDQGGAFMVPGVSKLRVVHPVPLTEDLKDTSGATPLRQLEKGEVLELLDWARTSKSALGVSRIRVRARGAGIEGWATAMDGEGSHSLEAV